MTKTATAAKTALHACACGGFKATDASGTVVARTGCTAMTRRTFAPGHDARLKGFLIRAGREGMLITTPWGGAELTAEKAASHFGFAHMVRDGIARKAAKKVAKKAQPKVTAKVGRWFYQGYVTEGGALFSYTDAKGASKTATKFTVQG